MKSVKELRQLTGLTQQAFSELTHIPLRTVQGYENGERHCAEWVLYLLNEFIKNKLKEG